MSAPMSPGRVLIWAVRALKVFTPLVLVILAGWLFGALPDTRHMLAIYMTLLLLCVGAGCVAMLAASQLAIHQAFSAGYMTGQASVWPDDADTQPERADDPVLRLVDRAT